MNNNAYNNMESSLLLFLSRVPLKDEITGPNPVCATSSSCRLNHAYPLFPLITLNYYILFCIFVAFKFPEYPQNKIQMVDSYSGSVETQLMQKVHHSASPVDKLHLF